MLGRGTHSKTGRNATPHFFYIINQREKQMSSDAKYPYTLSYKLPNGQEFIIDVETDGEAEDAFDTMFATCGPDIEYSIDE